MRGSRGRERKRKKTLPCGQHCPSGIRDAHVVRKIILSLTKQEEGGGNGGKLQIQTESAPGCPICWVKKKSKTHILLLSPPFSTGELAPSLYPQPPPPQGMGPGKEQKVCLEFHIPSILIPQCQTFKTKIIKRGALLVRQIQRSSC